MHIYICLREGKPRINSSLCIFFDNFIVFYFFYHFTLEKFFEFFVPSVSSPHMSIRIHLLTIRTTLVKKKRNFALFVTSIINFETNFKFVICKKTH